eukprot:4326494-Prymnesium_polylepis.1
MQLLVGSGARLMKPKLVACYRLWHDDWDANTKKTTAITVVRAGRELHEAQKAKVDVEAQLAAMQAELRAAKQALSRSAGQEDDLAKQLELELEAEREKRVAHLAQLGMRRIMQM